MVVIIKNFLDPYKMNLYNSGLVKQDEVTTSELISTNNDYKIILQRKDAKLWYSDNSFKFICKFNFKDIIGNSIFEIILNELDIFCLLDNMYQFLEFNMSDFFTSFNYNGKNYIFKFEKSFHNKDNYIMTIFENNNIFNYKLDRIRIEFDENKLLEFVDLIYFTFLIDVGNM